MKTITKPTCWKTYYVSYDNKNFETEDECVQYEKLMNNIEELKKLKFYDDKGNNIDIFLLKNIPEFSYLVLENDIPHYYPIVIKTILNNEDNDITSFKLPTSKGIWYNNWANAYSGGYGSNGWERVSDIDSLKYEVKKLNNTIEILEKMITDANKS